MILANKLHQICEYRRRIGVDEYAEACYEQGVDILCRREEGERIVADGQGRKLRCVARYFLKDAVEVGDMIDGRVVLNIIRLVSVFGDVQGYDVSC